MPDVAAGEIPHHFLCPISLDIMWDPVTVSSGHTFDRSSISAWLSTGNSTCPVTRSSISSDLIPNLTLRRLIHAAAAIPTPKSSPAAASTADPSFLKYLLSRSSGHKTPARVAALTRLSRLVRDSEETRSLLSSIPESRRVLESILFSAESDSDELRNESLGLLATLRLTVSDSDRIGFLVGLMREPNTIDVRANAVAVVDWTKIADEGMVEAVVAVIKDGVFFRRAMKVGVKALLVLCLEKQNRVRAVEAGAGEALVEVVANSADLEKGDVERALEAAELLCRAPEGCVALAGNLLAAGVLVRTILKVSERATEHAAGVLLAVCRVSERAREEAVAAGVVMRLLLVVQSGCTVRGKRKAVVLLKLLQDLVVDSDDYVCSDIVPY